MLQRKWNTVPQITKPRVFVHLLYNMDARNYRSRYLGGMEPDASPYGFHLAEDLGFEVSYSVDRKGRIYNAARRRISNFLGFDILHAFANIRQINNADIIWTMTEGEAFAVALLFRLRIVEHKPIIGNAVWVFDNWKYYSPVKKFGIGLSSSKLTVLTVHSKKCIPVAMKVFPRVKVKFQPFGINNSVFAITPPKYQQKSSIIKVLSIGNDETRDWSTLLKALGNDGRFKLRVVCWRLSDDQLRPYKNVEAIRSPSRARFLEEYENADVVVISMKENIFSGITVALEAVALGKPVLASRTGGLSSYFDEDEITYFPTNDPDALREAILQTDPTELTARAGKAQRRFLREDYSTKALIQSYANLTRTLLS